MEGPRDLRRGEERPERNSHIRAGSTEPQGHNKHASEKMRQSMAVFR